MRTGFRAPASSSVHDSSGGSKPTMAGSEATNPITSGVQSWVTSTPIARLYANPSRTVNRNGSSSQAAAVTVWLNPS